MRLSLFSFSFIFLLALGIVFGADDSYKPYLHKANIPDHPKVKLYGQYQTNLFPGAATYSYGLEVSQGINGLTPSLSLSYNSQGMKGRPSFLGAGWSITQSYIFRDVNSTPNNSTDDELKLILNGASYDLIFEPKDGFYHTETETFAKIQNLSTTSNTYNQYFLITLKDGTRLTFGSTQESELTSNTGKNYALKWSLDTIQDTHSNNIFYTYLEDPFPNDNGSVYLSQITYNNDRKRSIVFEYENQDRADRRRVFEQGNSLEESRRLSDITILHNQTLVRRYHFDYSSLNQENTLSSLTGVSYLGSDNQSTLHTIQFSYYSPNSAYVNSTRYNTSITFQDSSGNDLGVRLADLNNDGLIDLIKGADSPSQNIAFLNNRSGWAQTPLFSLPSMFVDSSYRDKGARLEDVNSDGFPDFIRAQAGSRQSYLSKNASVFEAANEWNSPLDFVDSSGLDEGVQFTDINGDGRVDIIRAKESATRYTYLNNGSGWKSTPSWNLPIDLTKSDGSDFGVRIVDVNGDGLPDLLRAYQGSKSAYLNTGSGWQLSSSWTPPQDFTTTSAVDNGIRLADLNGDGLVDMLQDYANIEVNGTPQIDRNSWINNGSGWKSTTSFRSPDAFTSAGKNVGRRIGDVNGDSFGDIIVGNAALTYTLVRNQTFPYLLKNITNELGGSVILHYTESTRFNNSGDDAFSDLGFNSWVVASEISINGIFNSSFSVHSNTSYSYKGGLYDHNDSEFRGFSEVNQTSSVDNSTTAHYFHQSKQLKGKEFKTEVYNKEGTLFIRSESNFNLTTSHNSSIYIANLLSSSSYTFDGQLTPKITNTSYTYDNYSNLISITQHGDTAILGDEKYQNTTYTYNTTAWILSKPSQTFLFDSNHKKIRDAKYAYDNQDFGAPPTKGDITKTESWLDSGGGNPTTRYRYDGFGNIIEVTDPLGRITKSEYGLTDITSTFPERITNALGLKTDFAYDLGTGNLLSQTKNGITTYFTYDTFGRIVKEIQPYDTTDLPTKTYTYSFDGVAPEMEKISQKTSANNTIDIHYFYDGFANLIQLRSPSGDGNQVIKNLFYDGMGRVREEQNPYFDAFSTSLSIPIVAANKSKYSYDPIGRVTQVTNPDGTLKRTTYSKWQIDDYDENSNYHTYHLDAHGRIIAVEEHNTDFYIKDNQTYNTTYSYDSADQLVGISDAYQNPFNFSYDSLGRKIRLIDPDLGTWIYSYDQGGNLILQKDNKGNSIRLGYDDLNRIRQKNGTSVNTSFIYDSQYQGTLSRITINNFTFSYSYDERMRAIRETLSELNGNSYETGYTYDSMNRIIEKRLPSGLELENYYNQMGKLERINGFVNSTQYNSLGSPLNRSYFNGRVTSFSYQENNLRLRQIKTDFLQQLNYTYDPVGNILSINDSINNQSYQMSYDNLDRLTNVTINGFSWVYHFDALGRILKVVRNSTETTSLKYDGPKLHFPSKSITSQTGADLYRQSDFNTSNKTKIVQFYLVNEKNSSLTNVNWSGEFGDGVFANSNVLFNLSKDENVLVVVEHNYSKGGNYLVNLTARAGASSDYQSMNLLFGAITKGIGVLRQNASIVVSEFKAKNTLSSQSLNWNWSCTNGAVSTAPFNMSGGEDILIVMEHSYSLSNSNLSCAVYSPDGNQSASTQLQFKGIQITAYNSTLLDSNTLLVKFEVINHFSAQNISWNLTADNALFKSTTPIELTQLQTASITQEINFTRGGQKTITLSVGAANFTDIYTETISIHSLTLSEFYGTIKNATARVFDFIIRNENPQITLSTWNISDPQLQNSLNLSSNESLIVVIEEDYGQGDKSVSIKIFNGTIQDDNLLDIFKIRQISIESFQTLHQDQTKSIIATQVKNNIGPLNLSWSLNNSQNIITPNQTIELQTSEQAIIVIESSANSQGIYPLNFKINSSTYNDNATGVAIS